MVQRNLFTNERSRKAASQLALSSYVRNPMGEIRFSNFGSSGRCSIEGIGFVQQAPMAVAQWEGLDTGQQTPVAVVQWGR